VTVGCLGHYMQAIVAYCHKCSTNQNNIFVARSVFQKAANVAVSWPQHHGHYYYWSVGLGFVFYVQCLCVVVCTCFPFVYLYFFTPHQATCNLFKLGTPTVYMPIISCICCWTTFIIRGISSTAPCWGVVFVYYV